MNILTPTPKVFDLIEGLSAIGTCGADALSHVAYAHSEVTLAQMAAVLARGQRETNRRCEGLAKTLTGYFSSASSGRFWHPTKNRSLTVRKAARLQGFEEGFAFPWAR